MRAALAAMLIALVGATGAVAPVAAAARVPKVAVIVGPSGDVTARYRALANDAAAAATATGAEVVKVYSPNATWPAVKRAVTGASVIVYLGHGNGWPSRYRDSLYPPTQNGFGLNAVAGGNDYDHQYFGEASVGKLQFAPNAVVVLSHLCYASGNTEPGLPEGTLDQAIQRVDNFAAGFLRAGARAVVAESYLGPEYYVKAVLRGRGSIEDIWSSSPTVNGRHDLVAPSARTAGYRLHLDPERASSGFVRSLVSRGVTAGEVRAGASGRTGGGGTTNPVVADPSLASAGIRFAEPRFKALPIAGTATRLTLPLATGRSTRIPAGAQVSVRWDPILLDAPPAPAPTVEPAPTPAPTPTPVPEGTPVPDPTVDPNIIARFENPNAPTIPPEARPAPDPTPTPAPTPTPVPEAPPVDLVVPEQVGNVVVPVKAARGAKGLSVRVAYPAAPGLYRLTATLHTPEGVAYDAATQDLLVPVLVRVGGAMAAAYSAPAVLSISQGATADVPVKVLNAGSGRWDLVVDAPRTLVIDERGTVAETLTLAPSLVATWIAADGATVPTPLTVRLDAAISAPGGTADALLAVQAPDEPGTYLLLLDVLTPDGTSMAALGSAPALVRVTVNAVATPAPASATAGPPAGPAAAPTTAPTPVAPVAPGRLGDN